jgi:hypothetical protein
MENDVKKLWMVYSHKNSGKLEIFPTHAEAVERATWLAHGDMDRQPYFILEAVEMVQRPLPNLPVEKLL